MLIRDLHLLYKTPATAFSLYLRLLQITIVLSQYALLIYSIQGQKIAGVVEYWTINRDHTATPTQSDCSLVMGPGQYFLTRLGQFLLLGLGRVTHLWFGFGCWKFPLKPQIFNFIPFGSESTLVKDWSASYLLQVKSTCSGWAGSEPISCYKTLI